MNHTSQHFVIHPEDNTNMSYWTKKWGVSRREINNAILETGSIDAGVIKSTLRKNHLLPNWFRKIIQLVKQLSNTGQQKENATFIGLRKVA